MGSIEADTDMGIDIGTLPAFLPLANGRRRYAWGSVTALPTLLGEQNGVEPVAEVWMGAHPSLPSIVELPGGPWRLDEAISAAPRAFLGERIVTHSGPRLPFLLKLLAADAPLSIQLHPGEDAARRGFEEENAAGIALDASTRVFVDPFAKPELIVALEPFRVLCGLREPADAAVLLGAVAATGAYGFAVWAAALERSGYDAYGPLITELVALEPGRIERVLGAVRSTVQADPAWTAEAHLFEELTTRYPSEPGALVALLLRQLTLRPGQGLALPAGTLHAYLSGVGLELMGSSDNVVRAGLTPKHCDPQRLVELLVPEAQPVVLDGEPAGPLRTYDAAWAGFSLQVVQLPDRPAGSAASKGRRVGDDAVELVLPGPGIACCLGGEIRLGLGTEWTELRRGEATFVRPVARVLRASGHGRVVVATTAIGEA